MARALSSAATLAATLSDGVAVLIGRRGYAGAAAAAVTGAAASSGRSSAEEKAVRKGGVGSSSSSDPWVPDPVTGYYRPENRRAEADAAELGDAHLARSSRD